MNRDMPRPTFKLIVFEDDEIIEIRKWATFCEKEHHRQQVAYSTHLEALTQICFDCKKIRTNYPDPD
jgi:hypothetical protein